MYVDVERVQKRVKAMTEGELLSWLGMAIPGMQRHLEAYERSRNADHLGELAIAEVTASLVITELLERKFGSSDQPSASSAEPTTTTTAPRQSRMRRALRGRSGSAPAVE